ncbi:50S ribosomal protein L25 [Candidatus Karelsulcia muelleri]|uniref:50S ribosomal protein L25 n=1 Tax=Candidatus Karelsulcia muelleri TaxID=336810 RepID=UPI000D7C7877|nr:50S ribosomal protein L25 [Candidatus Karelsulcia muelleri]
MNNIINIQGEKIKKKYNRELRNSGYVPCVIYRKKKNITFSVLISTLKKNLLKMNSSKIYLKIKNYYKIEAILKEIQFHPITENVIHLDFYELKKNNKYTISIPLISEGHSIGVSKGGESKLFLKQIKLKILKYFVLKQIFLNLSNLEIGNNFYLKKIYNPKYILLHFKKEVIASVFPSRKILKEVKLDKKEKEKNRN